MIWTMLPLFNRLKAFRFNPFRSPLDSGDEGRLWLMKTLDLLPKPFFLIDYQAKRVSFSNAAARRILGLEYANYSIAEIYGKLLWVYDPHGKLLTLDELPSARIIRGERVDGIELVLVSQSGRFNIKCYSEEIPSMFNQPPMALIIFQDITALKTIETDLRRVQAGLNDAVQIAQIGFWSVDKISGKTELSSELMRQFGLRSFDGQLKNVTSVIHSEDRPRVINAINESLNNGSSYQIEYRVVHPSGDIRWIEAKSGVTGDHTLDADRFSGTTLDITDRVLARQALEEARLTAERANLAKSQFLANMSHEIRTPLGAIMGFSQLIKENGLGKIEREEFASVIERNSLQLLRIVDDILDLSKVEAGMMLIETIEFSLPETLTDFASLMGFKAREKGIRFFTKAETTLPSKVHCDPTRLRQILMNVVGNAIKFTDRGQVEMRVRYAEPFLEFDVVDTGRGVSSEQLANLFQPFSQADTSTTRKYGGTGLGLVLTKSLSEALGGSFILKHSELGKGSVFSVRVKAPAAPDSKMFSGLGFETEPARTVANFGQLSGIKILLVEDSPDNQALISIYLSRAGARVEIASHGEQGYQMAKSGDYDIVLMDVQMPIMDGIAAVKKLRADGYVQPIVALTAHAMKEERIRCLQAGFTDFLSKPMKRDELIELIMASLKTGSSRTFASDPS